MSKVFVGIPSSTVSREIFTSSNCRYDLSSVLSVVRKVSAMLKTARTDDFNERTCIVFGKRYEVYRWNKQHHERRRSVEPHEIRVAGARNIVLSVLPLKFGLSRKSQTDLKVSGNRFITTTGNLKRIIHRLHALKMRKRASVFGY